jgi:hypothetical protein
VNFSKISENLKEMLFCHSNNSNLQLYLTAGNKTSIGKLTEQMIKENLTTLGRSTPFNITDDSSGNFSLICDILHVESIYPNQRILFRSNNFGR